MILIKGGEKKTRSESYRILVGCLEREDKSPKGQHFSGAVTFSVKSNQMKFI